MARRIRWQIVIASVSATLIVLLLSVLAISNTTVARPMAGGTYTEAIIGTPSQIIPLLNTSVSDPVGRDLAVLIFDGLTRIGIDGLPEPALAESWESNQTGEQYTFHLRRGVKWHDGTPVTANDIVFTLHAIQQSSFPGDPALAGLWRNVFVDRVDDYTIHFTLNAPYAPFLYETNVPILPEHLLANTDISQWATSPFAKKPIGTGPYQFAELTNDHAILQANTNYFDGVPFIERMEISFIESPQSAFSVLSRQSIHALGVNATPELAHITLPKTIRRINVPLDGYTSLAFNLRQPPLDHLPFRQALARGFNKNVLIKQVLKDVVARIDTPILPGWWAYDSTIQWYDYVPQGASQELDRLGYTRNEQGVRLLDGQPLVLPLITDNSPVRIAAAQEVARQWDEIGIKVQIEPLESSELRQRLREHRFTMAIHSWARLGPDPDVFELWHSSQSANGSNYAGLQDDAIDQALIQGRTQVDYVKRQESYANFQKRWIELVPSIILYQPLYVFNASEELGGLSFEKSQSSGHLLLIGAEDRYRNVSRWFVQSSKEIQGTLR